MTAREAPHLQRLPALDGLRGLAAAAVIVAHFADYLGALPWTPLGGMGVLIFFVLSGYLIARLSLRIGQDWEGYRTFIWRRVVRLGPAILTVSAVVPLLLWLDGLPGRQAAAEAGRTATQTAGFATALGWSVHPALQPTWSLTTEWLFYLAFPLAVLLAVRRHASTQALARWALVSAPALYLLAMPLDHAQFYSLPLANLGVMCVGAALAFAHRSQWTGPQLITTGVAPYGALAIVLIFVLLPGQGASWGYRLSVLPATSLSAAVIIHGIHHHHPIRHLLAWRPLVQVGVRAYSLYLWHLPVMWFVWRLVGAHGLGWMILLDIPLITAVTVVSFAIFERPVLRASRRSGSVLPPLLRHADPSREDAARLG